MDELSSFSINMDFLYNIKIDTNHLKHEIYTKTKHVFLEYALIKIKLYLKNKKNDQEAYST